MAAYKYTLSDADLSDLVSYLEKRLLLEFRQSAA